MPYHVAPPIRALEEMRESAGIQTARDTAAVTIEKTKESLGVKAKVVPSFFERIIAGVKYKAS